MSRLNELATEIDLFEHERFAEPERETDPESEGLIDQNPLSQDDEQVGMVYEPEAGLVLDQLQVQTPGTGQVLIESLSLAVKPGESLLVMGGSGCGKTSLLRTIAGLWTRGRGQVRRPPDEEILFLPQQPYMIIGNLRQQVLYPQVADATAPARDHKIFEMLNFVRLSKLSDRVGGLGQEANWKEELSTGEQQRIGFARLFLQAPKMCFLDEATSALDQENETHLYTRLKSLGCVYVSVGHRHSLVQFHTHVLHFTGPGEYTLQTAEEFLSKK